MSAPAEVKGTSEDCAGSYIPCAEDQYRPGHASSTRWDISKKMAAHDRSVSKLREFDSRGEG